MIQGFLREAPEGQVRGLVRMMNSRFVFGLNQGFRMA